MIDSPKRAYLSLPENYYDLDEVAQDAICLQMADALIAALGAPDKLPSETPNRLGS